MTTLLFFCAMAATFVLGTAVTAIAHKPRRDAQGRFAPPCGFSLLNALDVVSMAIAGLVGGILFIIAIVLGVFA